MEKRNNRQEANKSMTSSNAAAAALKKSGEDYHHVELKRLKEALSDEAHRIRFPRRRDHHPYVFNDLNPYYNVKDVENLINAPDNLIPIGYHNRYTALTIVEPWVAHRMEGVIAPSLNKSVNNNLNTSKSHAGGDQSIVDENKPKNIEGSTLAPNFPKLNVHKPRDMKGPFSFADVSEIRKELKRNLTNKNRFDEDRNRTINDYYRMRLDQTAEKEKMIEAYHAYLENTPGSKKALEELLKNNKTLKLELVPMDEESKGATTKGNEHMNHTETNNSTARLNNTAVSESTAAPKPIQAQ